MCLKEFCALISAYSTIVILLKTPLCKKIYIYINTNDKICNI